MPVEVAEKEVELDEREIRVLGCLIEKELSTPDYYPMTINALASACNQKTNRDPVADYSESEVREAVESLQRKRLVGSASSSYGRVAKYRHALAEVLGLDESRRAVLASLMLRGPETSGEIRGRSSRMFEFASLEAVDAVLDEMSGGDRPLIAQLPKRPGQKEARFAHRFGDELDRAPESEAATSTSLQERVHALEGEVAVLRDSLVDLEEAFRTFRKQFE